MSEPYVLETGVASMIAAVLASLEVDVKNIKPDRFRITVQEICKVIRSSPVEISKPNTTKPNMAKLNASFAELEAAHRKLVDSHEEMRKTLESNGTILSRPLQTPRPSSEAQKIYQAPPPQETNPNELWTPEWYAWKERRGYLPYHVGSRPDGTPCTTMPRVVLTRPGVYKCPDCGKEFPTATAELEDRAKETK